MLQVNRGKIPKNRYYGFISYCTQCGNSQAFCVQTELGNTRCYGCNDNLYLVHGHRRIVLCFWWLVPSDMEGILQKCILGTLAYGEALSFIWCDALVTLGDFFLADQLTSQVQAIRSL
ncbi:PREDICTED: uncharacterized protein LOC104594177 [Nelumbo nucifera]|uniref:Uncharacterized protein LOC104594177 n=1 Tax=Nelumbo nucifera TaxID=4432 RepID=A0A1U7ZVZ5_NELNU|nr:PREDICTED: uncharacterized protein LOC104594177 [Nelumbo nucifera]